MAKALLGYVGAPDYRMVSEMRRLHQRIRELESELTKLQAENAALAAVARDHDLLTPHVAEREPVLT